MFKRKKKKGSRRVEVKSIPLPILMRQAIYDSMLEPAEDIANALGLPPISDEVAEMEVQASQERLELFSPLIPFIDSHASLAARITTSAYMLDDENNLFSSMGDEDIDRLTDLFKIVAISSTMSCISSLFNLGLLETRVQSNGE
jgi:hypothetical protein